MPEAGSERSSKVRSTKVDLYKDLNARAELIARGAAEWRDRRSWVRREARERLRKGAWSEPVVEAALEAALWDLDLPTAERLVGIFGGVGTSALVILPGNVLGPAVVSAYCAAVTGSRAILKAGSDERQLAEIVEQQFESLGPPLARTVQARYWRGGDLVAEAAAFEDVSRVIAFGEDATIADIARRAPASVDLVAYGEAYSIGLVGAGAPVDQVAHAAAFDVCMFDQRGCMSPQTIYVAGPRQRAAVFARALALKLAELNRKLPRAHPALGEAEAAADLVRRMSASAFEPEPGGTETFIVGPLRDLVPDFVVAVEPFGEPRCAGFGRAVSVRPLRSTAELGGAIRAFGRRLDTVGTGGDVGQEALASLGALRVCPFGEMQRPPFGYRPKPSDFAEPGI